MLCFDRIEIFAWEFPALYPVHDVSCLFLYYIFIIVALYGGGGGYRRLRSGGLYHEHHTMPFGVSLSFHENISLWVLYLEKKLEKCHELHFTIFPADALEWREQRAVKVECGGVGVL